MPGIAFQLAVVTCLLFASQCWAEDTDLVMMAERLQTRLDALEGIVQEELPDPGRMARHHRDNIMNRDPEARLVRSNTPKFTARPNALAGVTLGARAAAAAAGSAHQRQGQCGTSWQKPYVELHRMILAGERPRRYVISIASSGMSDRVNGAVAAFFYALLTGRALLIGFDPSFERDDPLLPMAYLPASFNWTLPRHMANWEAPGVQLVSVDYGFCSKPGDDIDFYRHIRWENVSKLVQPTDQEVVVFRHNCGWILRIFKNPYHREHLHALGLNEANAFKCIFSFLFQLPKRALQIAQPFLDTFARPDTVSIAIQIRLGDFTLYYGNQRGDNLALLKSLAYPFLSCAEELEKDLKIPTNRVVWFLISDSVQLRTWVNSTYPGKIMTIIPKTIMHTGDMDLATAEQWSFAKADFHIISKLSAFGRLGAALGSKPYDSVFTIHQDMPNNDPVGESFFPAVRKCRLENADPRNVWTSHWSQV